MKRSMGLVIVLAAGAVGCGQASDLGLASGRKVKPPPPEETVPCRVTGGGQIVAGEFPDTLGGNAQWFRGDPDGEWNHLTHEGEHFHGDPDFIECYVDENDEEPPEAGASAIRFTGTGTYIQGPYEGEECTFEVYIEDHGEPGTDDFYEITITCGGTEVYSAANTLLHGNLQIHEVPPGQLGTTTVTRER